MPSNLLAELNTFRDRLAGLDAQRYAPADAAAVVTALAKLGKACTAARSRFAARAAAGGAHREEGFADPGDWLADKTGESTSQARKEIGTAGAVEDCPATAEALANGELSVSQANEIANAEAANPGSEGELLDVARRKPLRRLQDEARKKRLEKADPEELADRQHKARSFRHWRNAEGMVCGSFCLPPTEGAAVVTRLDAAANRIRKEARRRGSTEPWEAHAADAFVGIVLNGSTPNPRKADVVFVCDLRAWRRGHTHPDDGEVCHVVGGGGVPVRRVREEIDNGDPFVKAVIHDGVRIGTIRHFGRYLKAELRTALDLGPPPHFDGRQCGCGCGKVYNLQNDHIDPLANGGATEYDNLQPRTSTEHAAKTEQDRRAGRLRHPTAKVAGTRAAPAAPPDKGPP